MTRTTADWEALLKDATPGPWEWDEYRVPTLSGTHTSSDGSYQFQDEVLEAEHDGRCGCQLACELELHVSDADKNLIAIAPEAVAEVTRLRRELARLAEFIAGYPLQQVLVASPTNGQRALDMQAKSVAIIKHIIAEDMETTDE